MTPDIDRSNTPANDSLAIGTQIVFCRLVNSVLLILLVVIVFLSPVAIVVHDLTDAKIRDGRIPHAAWKLYHALTPKYARWARERTDSTRALELSTSDVAGTEWPLFGSVFYLLAIESLQDAWETDHSLASVAPNIYAKEAIAAATQLVIDPKQAGWVKKHWGENYLKRENVFYRMLVISALTSHMRLTGNPQHLEFLRNQVESLSAEIDASRHGLLDDYPGECYPGDVLTAIAMIRKADRVLETDHASFVARAIRGFENQALDSYGLVPYFADAETGKPFGPSRGCGNSYVSLFSPAIWPAQAQKWYDLYAQHFWQEGKGMAGFREFPKEMRGGNWYIDVDSGPVFNGFGAAACAFGTGAARVNGRFDHAYPLMAELYATSWPLPNRTLLLPRLLSNAADAPYLGEAGILYILTRSPMEGVPIRTGGKIPNGVIVGIAIQFAIGAGLTWLMVRGFRKWWNNRSNMVALLPKIQFRVWLGFLGTALVLLLIGQTMWAMIPFLLAQFFPGCRIRRPSIASPLPQSPPP